MEIMEKDLQRELYINCLSKQLEEINLLSSIYCNNGELQIHDPSVISDFNEYVDGTSNSLRLKLDFSIFLTIATTTTTTAYTNSHSKSNAELIRTNEKKYEVRFDLPHLYPLLENVNVTIRNAAFTKNQEKFLNEKIQEFINNEIDDKCEPYIYQICIWIQDKFYDYLKLATESTSNVINYNQQKNSSPLPSSSSSRLEKIIFERLWIYSHHIKSKTKRQEILRQAKDLQLTGFFRPGKPGIMCVEGIQSNTQEFWRTIKSMQWQKITIKKIETKQLSLLSSSSMASSSASTSMFSSSSLSPSSSSSFSSPASLQSSSIMTSLDSIDRYRRFTQFKEELFTNINNVDSNVEEKMNMSLFMKFLELHNCGYMKKELFGFD